MKHIELAKNLLPVDISCQEVPLLKGRLPVPSMIPIGDDNYYPGIIVPAIDVEESIDILLKNIPDDPFVVIFIEEILRNAVLDEKEKMSPNDYATFSIFHELGHWYDYQKRFVDLGLDGMHYLEEYKRECEELELLSLQKKVREAEKDSKRQNDLLRLFHQKYRENKFEIIADNYAITRMHALPGYNVG